MTLPGGISRDSRRAIFEAVDQMEVKDATFVLDTNAYASGDVLAVPLEIENVFKADGGERALHSVVVLDEDDQGAALDLVFFNASAALGTINAAVSISDADARKIIGVVNVEATDYTDLVNSQVAMKTGLGIVLKAGASTKSLWVGAITRGAPTHTASGIKIKLGFI